MTARLPERPTLADLILAGKGNGTYYDLEDKMPINPRTKKPALGWKRIQQMATNPLKGFPDPESIRALASALGYSEEKIVMACCESLGIEVHRPPSRFEVLLPAGVDRLTDEEVSAVLGLLRVQIAAHRTTPA